MHLESTFNKNNQFIFLFILRLGLYFSNTQKIGIEMDCIWLSSITVWGIRGQRENQVFLGIKYFNPIQFKPSYRVYSTIFSD